MKILHTIVFFCARSSLRASSEKKPKTFKIEKIIKAVHEQSSVNKNIISN